MRTAATSRYATEMLRSFASSNVGAVRAESRACIVDAAAHFFSEYGRDGISMRELARHVGVSVPSFYYYFSSKEDLYRAVVTHKITEMITQMQDGVEHARDAREKFCALVGCLFDALTGDRVLLQLLQQEIAAASVERRVQLYGTSYIDLAALVNSTASDLIGRKIDPAVARSINALILGTCQLHSVYPRVQSTNGALKKSRTHLIRMALSIIRFV